MFNLGTIGAAVKLDDSQYKRKLASMEQQSNKTFKNIAMAAGAFLSFRAAAKFMQEAVKAYSDLEETTSKFNVVFGNVRTKAKEASDELRKFYGLSEGRSKQMLGDTGDLLSGFGFDQKTALKLSRQVARLGVDLASFSNYSGGAKGAAFALTKAMLGETEQAKMLGIAIKTDSKEYKELLKHFIETKGLTEIQAKAFVALEIATKQSKNAIGDFSRTQNELANQQRKQTENLEDFSATVGGLVGGPYTDLLGMNNAVLESFNALDSPTKKLILSATALGTVVLLMQTNLAKTIKQQIIWALASKSTAVANNVLTASSLNSALGMRTQAVAAKGSATALGALKAATIASAGGVKALGAAIAAHPVGFLLTLAAGAYMVLDATNALGFATSELSEKQQKLRESGDELRQVDDERMSRLEQLASYTSLSNDEMDETRTLLKDLNKYGSEQWAVLDKQTKQLKLATDARKKFNDQIKEAAMLQLDAELTEVEENIKKIKRAIEDAQGFWATTGSTISNLKNVFLEREGTNSDMDNEAGKLTTQLAKRLAIMKKIKNLQDKDAGKNTIKTLKERAKLTEKIRDAEADLKDAQWEFKFRGLETTTEKMAFLHQKIKETEATLQKSTERGDKLAIAQITKELLALKQRNIDLEKERQRQQKQFKDHKKSYGDIDKNYKERVKNKKIDRAISEAIRRGDRKHAEEMIKRQIELGRMRAKQADEEYKRRHAEAMRDGKMSDKEKKDLDRIKENKQKALAREEKYGDKLYDMQNKKSVNQTVGAFQAALFDINGNNSNSPQKRTADAAEKQVKILKKVEKNTKNGSAITYKR